MNRYGIVVGHCLLFFLHLPGWAQLARPAPYVVQVRQFSIEQGLPSRSVTHMAQDQDGFVWIGTLTGAYRFDGRQFLPLPPRTRPSRSQLPFFVDQIYIEPDGTRWFFEGQNASRRQVWLWAPGQPKPIRFEDQFGHSLPTDVFAYVRYIGQRGQPQPPARGRVKLFTESGAVYAHTGAGRFRQLFQLSGGRRLLMVSQTGSGRLWLTAVNNTGSSFDLLEIDTSGRVHRQLSTPAPLLPICADTTGGLYLCRYFAIQPRLSAHRLDDYLYRLDASDHLSAIPIALPTNSYPDPAHYFFYTDQITYDPRHDLFWLLGNGVLQAWHPRHGIVFDLKASGFPMNRVPTINRPMIDRTGVLWVATGDGFLVIHVTPNRFQQYLSAPDNAPAQIQFSTRGIAQVGQRLWVANQWVDLRTGAAQPVGPQEPGRLYAALRGSDGALWTAGDILFRTDPATGQAQSFPLRGQNFCLSIWPDRRQHFWLGYDQGLSYFDTHRRQNLPFTRYNQFAELAENRVNGFFADPRRAGGLWVAASSGLYWLDTLRGITERYSAADATPRHLPVSHITFVRPDPDQPGVYWLATRGEGLLRWERTTGRCRQFTQADGLLNPTLYCVYTDHPDPARRTDKNRLWLTTDYGLVSFNKQTGQFLTYLPRDGIAHEEFNLTAHYQASDGRLFLGGLNGVTAFWPSQIGSGASSMAPLRLTGYRQLDAQTGTLTDYTASYRAGQPFVLSPSVRAIELTVALLDYRYLNQTQLQYRIRGWQESWLSQMETTLRINGLPAGDYTLEIRMQLPNGQWASQTLSIPILVEAPVYRRWWFLLLMSLLVAGVGRGVWYWRTRRIINDNHRLETEVAQRTAQLEIDKAIIVEQAAKLRENTQAKARYFVQRTAELEADKAIIEQQAAQLRENARNKARFLANVSHEFRTPITLLLGPISYLSKRVSDLTQQQLLASMGRNALHLERMVNDLLDLSRSDAGQLTLQAQPADLIGLIRHTVDAFAMQALMRQIQLTVSEMSPALWLQLDAAKVETVVRNLIANALRFTPSGGQVRVELQLDTEQVRLSVTDTGSGIHPDDLPHIFERYYQSNQPDAPTQGGTGIGLSLCREYCTLWGGSLTVNSVWGQGTVASFTHPVLTASLPFAGAVPDRSVLQTAAQADKPIQQQDTLVVVEDNPDMLVYLQLILAPRYAIQSFSSGLTAWQWLQTQPVSQYPQAILTDLMMPDMDGLTLLQHIRTHADLQLIPVLMLTARTDLAIRAEALQLGVADYMTKPFDAEQLHARLQNLLERADERIYWRNQPADPDLPADLPNDTLFFSDNWLQRLAEHIRTRLTDRQFTIDELATILNMSRSQLYRRVKERTGLSPVAFVQEIRLLAAYELLQTESYQTLKEITIAVGFQKPFYFKELFQKRFGVNPASLLMTNGNYSPPAS